jgi:ATP-dependent helicase/nuclease subunit B
VLGELRARPWSASALEVYLACPSRWFIERVLRPATPDPDPEPLARGGLAHAALADTLEGLRRRTGSARVTVTHLPFALELLGDALARHEQCFPLSARAERLPGARRRLRADLERYLRHAAATNAPSGTVTSTDDEGGGRRAGALEPAWLELQFGFDEHEEELPALDLGEGVVLRGRIDRIDVTSDGRAVVYDYKGARVTPGAKWLSEGRIQLALYMHAAERLLGLRVVGGMYQPLSGVDLRARGVLDVEAGVALDCVRTDLIGAAELGALVHDALALARASAARAVRGAVESRPHTCSYTGVCAYPAICRCGR